MRQLSIQISRHLQVRLSEEAKGDSYSVPIENGEKLNFQGLAISDLQARCGSPRLAPSRLTDAYLPEPLQVRPLPAPGGQVRCSWPMEAVGSGVPACAASPSSIGWEWHTMANGSC